MSEELINKIIIYNFHEFGDEFGNALVGLQQENQQLKLVLDEIREYIKETLDLKEEYPEEVECVVNDLLQISDKAVKE